LLVGWVAFCLGWLGRPGESFAEGRLSDGEGFDGEVRDWACLTNRDGLR
jgi:hypothetical protein